MKTSDLSADNLTSMGRHLSPQYGEVILVSEYPVLTALISIDYNIDVQYECIISFPVLPN